MIDEAKLLRVSQYNKSLVAQCMRYFNQFPENEIWFADNLNTLAWDNKYRGQYRNHISLTALPLATKIYEQLGIITFPFIQRVACRGWDTAGGTWAWAMRSVSEGRDTGDIGSTDPVRYLLKKGIKLFVLEGINSNGEIGGQ